MEKFKQSLFEISQSKNTFIEPTLHPTPVREATIAQNNDNNARDTFYKIISHELRTPINVVLGSIQLFEMVGDNPSIHYSRSKLKAYNTIMKKNCFRLLRSVNNLIDVSKLSSGDLNICILNHDIVQTINEIVQSAKPYALEKEITIQLGSKYDRFIFAFDKEKISRAVLNLISNAIKFTPEGGRIFIHIRKRQDVLCISVRDTGIGIPENHMSNIFNQFVQVDSSLSRSFEGTGIGLTIVNQIVSLHEGKVKVKSRVGKGSTFTIELPLRTTTQPPCTETIAKEYSLSPHEMVAVELSDLF